MATVTTIIKVFDAGVNIHGMNDNVKIHLTILKKICCFWVRWLSGV